MQSDTPEGPSEKKSGRAMLWRVLRFVPIAPLLLVLTQDLQIFPGIWHPVLRMQNNAAARASVRTAFVRTPDNEKLEVWVVPPEVSSSGRNKVAILFHGNGESVDTAYPLQRWFAKRGYQTYSFDYRGYGNSTGWPSESGLYLDALSVWNFVKEDAFKKDPQAQEPEILIVGVSIGTGIAAFLASEIQPEAMLLYSPYSSLPATLRDRPLLGYLAPFLLYELPTATFVSQLKQTCLFIVHGGADTIIDNRHSQLVADAYTGPHSRMKIFERSGHNDIFLASREYVAEVLAACPRLEAGAQSE